MPEVVLEILQESSIERIKSDFPPDLTDKKKLNCCENCGYLKEYSASQGESFNCPNGCNEGYTKKWNGMIALISPEKSYAGRLLKRPIDDESDSKQFMRLPGLYAEEY